MYAVLPPEMKLAERPQKEIDRALLSRVDFASGDVAQFLITASLLSRMQAFDRAMELCQELTRHNPWQPVIWIKAKSIADNSGNPEHILRARVGILKHVWTNDADALHEEAKLTLEELSTEARRAGRLELADRIQDALQAATTCDLMVQAEWAGDGDVDLLISEPGGHQCDHRHRITKNGGLMTRISAGGKRRQTEEYRCLEAPNGDYEITVRLIRGRVITGRVVMRVTRYAGTSHEETRTVRVPVGTDDGQVRVSISRGRG